MDIPKKIKLFFSKKDKAIYLYALIVSILVFVPYIIGNNGVLLLYGDLYEQSFKLWQGGWTQFHNGTLSQFNLSLGLGANTFSYIFYFLTNPLYWISLLFPRGIIKYIFLIQEILTLFLSFVFTHIWLKKITSNNYSAIVGAFIVAFGAYNIFYLQAEHFLKALVLYPLILYLVEEYLQKHRFILLVIFIGILGITHYYLLYQFIPFLLLYTLFRYLIIHKEDLKFKSVILEATKFLLIITLGIMLSAITLLPCAYLVFSMPRFSNLSIDLTSHLNIRQIYKIITSLFTPTFEKLDANYFISTNNHDFIGWSGGVPLYCMIITPMLLPLILKIKDKFSRNIYLIFASSLGIFLFFKAFTYLFQSSIDTRWYYMFYLLFAMITAKVLDNIEDGIIDRKYVILTGTFVVISIIICIFISYLFKFNTNRNILKLAISSIVIITFAILYIICINKSYKKMLIIILSLEAIYSGLAFYYNNEPIVSWALDLPIYNNEIYNDLKDSSFYRVIYDPTEIIIEQHEDYENDTLGLTTSNEPMANGYAGFSFYTSVYNTNQEEFINRFKSTWNMPQLLGRTKIFNLLSSKYFYSYYDNFPVPAGYELIAEQNGYKLYENTNYVELGFTYDKTINRDDVIDLSYLEQDRIMQEYLITETSSNHEYTLHDNLELLTILPTDTIRVYEFEKPVKNVILYFETFGIPNVKITTYLNDEVVNSYDVWQFNYIDIPIYEDIDKVVIEGEDVYGNGTEIYMHQEPIDDDYSQRFKQLTNEHFTNVVFDNDHISADITINDHEKYVFTSIPYDKGWTVKVNGEQIDYEKVQLGFIGFKLNEGTFHIEFDYHIPLLKEGSIVSILAIVILLFLSKIKH